MNSFDPGEGWMMRQFEGEVPNDVVAYREDDGSWTYWVRKKSDLLSSAESAAEKTLRELGYVKSTDHVTGAVKWWQGVES